MKTLLLWLVPLAALLLAGGLVAELAGFFTLAALVTFGGAYAVLPFVASAAVDRFGWLTADDMVAGLALGESTPGPLGHQQARIRRKTKTSRCGTAATTSSRSSLSGKRAPQPAKTCPAPTTTSSGTPRRENR